MITLVDPFEVKPAPNAYRARQMTIYDLAIEWEEESATQPFTSPERRGPRVWTSEE